MLHLLLKKIRPNISIHYNSFGAPKTNTMENISISHTNEKVAIIISKYKVGLDIEKISSRVLKVSEKFIQSGIYLSLNQKEKSKKIYKEIITNKNKFYSLLALNSIIDNDLEQNNEEVLKLFDIVENIKIEKEQKNLIKLKKALYLIKISRDNEGKKLLD